MVSHARLDAIAAVIERHWPMAIAPTDLANRDLWADVVHARQALLGLLGLDELA